MSIASVVDTGRTIYKVDVIADAYSRLRISGLTVNPTPEDLELALMRLEDMMAEWESRNMTVNYNFEDEPDPNSITNVQAGYKRAMSTNLARDLAQDFNKELHPSLYQLASSSLDSLSGRVALQRLGQVPYPNRQPVGSGNSLRWNRWARFYRDSSGAGGLNNSITMYIGDINDYREHFDAYLNDGETIASYSIQVDSGLLLVSDSIDGSDVVYRIQAENPNNSNNNYSSQVTIIVTTSEGRVETKVVLFTLIARD